MNTLEFLQRVLPSDGFYATAVISDVVKHGFFSTVEELAQAIDRSERRNENVYYAVASFKSKGARKQDNVHAIKSFYLDIDCGEGKPYPHWHDGLKALLKFMGETNLPKPMVVFSGNGLHVYWTLTRSLSPDEWLPIARALKDTAIKSGLHIDPAVTADSARILRPIGTHNPKGGLLVDLKIDAPAIDPEDIFECLKISAMKSRIINGGAIDSPLTGLTLTKPVQSNLLSSLAVKQDYPPAMPAVVASKCKQIDWATKNQSEVPEPLWYSLMGIAAFCVDPEATAVEWSQNHPSFDYNSTIRKVNHWRNAATGPTTCNKFNELRPEGCKGCKFKDKIGSPARLGLQYQEVAVAQTAPDKAASIIPIPKPFKRTATGIKMTLDESDIDICKFDIYPVSYGRDESLGYEVVRYHWNRPHIGWQELVLRQAHLNEENNREFASHTADQGIVLSSKTQTRYFQHMLRSYMDELRNIRTMTNLYNTMGWKENFSEFILGDVMYRRNPDGTVSAEDITLSQTSNRVTDELYGSRGTVEEWRDFTAILDKADMPIHMFALGIAFSSPLYAFTGLKGMVVSLYGSTGGGKTLAQYWMQSVYGNPDRLHFAAKFTQNTLFSRMGLYSNMPFTIDEVTMMADKEVGDFLYLVSQGQEKARLNRNAEERSTKSWCLPVVVSTNKSMQSKLISSGLDTDAQMARLLEITVYPHKLFTKDSTVGRKIYQFLMSNYGTVGPVLIRKYLEIGEVGIKAMIAEATSSFHKEYGARFSGEERYWEQCIILASVGNKIAAECGLIAYDPKRATEYVLQQIGAIRKAAVDNKMDAFDTLAEYMNDTADAAVTIMHTVGQKPALDYARVPRADIRVRFDVYRSAATSTFDRGTMMIDRIHFRKWMSAKGVDWKSFLSELVLENVVATPKSEKMNLGKDTPTKLGQSYVIGINLNHPRLSGILDAADGTMDDLTLGKLSVVQ